MDDQHSAQTRAPDIPLWVRDGDGLAFGDIPVQAGGRMPDFCIIGSPKCGTTSLDRYLSTHEDVFVCVPKEPHYFSTPALLARGDDWYRGLFAQARPDQICGEASTSYTRYPLVPGTAERMFAANPAMKLIYIIRNPVARVQSEALQTQKYLKNVLGKDYRHMSLDAFLDMVEDPGSPYYSGIVETSKYDQQLAAFEAVFPADQILLVTQSALRRDTEALMRQVHGFLGLSDPGPVADSLATNVTADYFEGSAREATSRKLQNVPGYGLMRALLPKRLRRALMGQIARPVPQANTRLSETRLRALEDILIPATTQCAARLGQPWQDW